MEIGQERFILALRLGREGSGNGRLGCFMLANSRARFGGKAEVKRLVSAHLDPPQFLEPRFDFRERVWMPEFAERPAEMNSA